MNLAEAIDGSFPNTCGLCGHEMTFERCGLAGAGLPDGGSVILCHQDHDCYHAWTLYGTRPGDPWPEYGCGPDPR